MPDHSERYRAIVDRLRENGHKLTPQRLAIAKILGLSEGHPSAEDIYRQLQDDFPTMSLATVYRNVLLIKSLGEVLELGFADGSNRYDGNRPYPHPHVVCVKCKAIIEQLFCESFSFKSLFCATGQAIVNYLNYLGRNLNTPFRKCQPMK